MKRGEGESPWGLPFSLHTNQLLLWELLSQLNPRVLTGGYNLNIISSWGVSMTTFDQNTIVYDWLSFSSKIDSPLSLISLLGLESVKFEKLSHGRYGYMDCLYFEGISILYNGRSDMGVCCEMSGKGCRAFEDYGHGDYEKIFKTVLENYSDNKELCQMRVTRVDIAYNDFNFVLDLPLLARETRKLNFVSRFSKWEVIEGNEGLAVNHGSQKSNVYIRIYDKRMEQKLSEDNCPHWVRAEIQLRHENALGFIMSDKSIQVLYWEVLNNYLRYIVESKNTSNRSMVKTAQYWLDFLESVEKRSIFYKPGSTYNFSNLYSYVTENMSGAISTVVAIVGADQLLSSVEQSRKGRELNPKYKSLLREYEEHGQNILETIGEA